MRPSEERATAATPLPDGRGGVPGDDSRQQTSELARGSSILPTRHVL